MVILIVSTYLDGEVRSIEGYAKDEQEAKQIVEELNYTIVKGESYFYTTEYVEKIKLKNGMIKRG